MNIELTRDDIMMLIAAIVVVHFVGFVARVSYLMLKQSKRRRK